MTEKRTEALEKLNRGIQESRRDVQQRTMNLAQDYFGDSADELKQQIEESRATLEGLPDQVPGGREEAFQALFQELMDNYSAMEECINEARDNVTNLDTDQIRRQGEVEATDAARRQARELGMDLTEIEGTGADGRITADDIKKLAETMEDAEEAPKVSDVARRRAEEMGIDLSQVEGTGSGGQITVKDVTSLGEETKDQATDQAVQAAQQAQDAAGGAAQQAEEATDQVSGRVDQVAAQAGQLAGQSDGANGGEINATDAAIREAEQKGIDLSQVEGTGADGRIVIWDVAEMGEEEGGFDPAEKMKNQAGDAAEQANRGAGDAVNRAGQVASQVRGRADGALGQVGGATNQISGQAVGTARQTTDQTARAAQSAQSNVAGQVEQGNGTQGGIEEPNATKAARRKAEDLGVDLTTVKGTGSGGLITIKDVVDS